MGTWNAGNFDNDGALDYVGELMDELQGKVDGFFDGDDPDLDEGEEMVVPSVAIMQLLAEHTGAAPPKADLIKNWQAKYLKVFDEQIDSVGPQGDYKAKRRQTISRTFKGFEKLSKAFWDKGNASNGGGANGDSGDDEDEDEGEDDDGAPRAVAAKPAPAKANVQSSSAGAKSSGSSSSGAPRAKRRFEFVEGSSSKFWEIELSGTSYTTTWGRIGTSGQSKTKDCPTEARASAEYDKLVEEKTGKGYEEV